MTDTIFRIIAAVGAVSVVLVAAGYLLCKLSAEGVDVPEDGQDGGAEQ